MINAELKLGRNTDAITWLKNRTKLQPSEPLWWSLLATAYRQDNKLALHHFALAEKFALEGALPYAIDQLKIARSIGGSDFYQASTIDARIRDYQRMFREQQQEDGRQGRQPS